jgi:hypothetical protein
MRILVVLTCVVLFFSSCLDRELRTPASTGRVNSVSVIISDQLWSGEIGDSIRKKFAAPVDGLPQEEPLFTINQYPVKALDGRFTGRNVFVVRREDKASYKIVSDQFASPQNVVHISGKNVPEILKLIEDYADSIIERFKQTEIEFTQHSIDTARLDDSRIRRKFLISLKVPETFNYALERRNFVWLKKEFLSGSTSILVYRVPFRSILRGDDIASNIINVRDAVGGRYIHGKVQNSRMITEESYAPYFQPVLIAGRRAYETKGTWELKGDFMTGAFINYAIMDRTRKEFVIIEGFCYAPSTDKRDMMHELEAIIKSVKFLKP